ncbi:MAG: hypothetical protein GF307_12505 [candidate division Zixibacteria bacterium]|nr:hypothetical protein [candidate division Zixibacteria bacterium]
MKIRFILIAVTVILVITGCVKDKPTEETISDVELYINEIFAAGDGPDWLEIYNPGTANVDIGGFHVYDEGTLSDKHQLPSPTAISPGGFLVIYCDDEGQGLHANFKLSSSGEEVWLEDVNGKIVDNVDFPQLEDNTSYGRFPDGGDDWQVMTVPTEGASNQGISSGPRISSVQRTPVQPASDDSVRISAIITDDSGIDSTILFFDTTGTAFIARNMKNTAGSDEYYQFIPAASESTTVRYYIRAVDDSALAVTSPSNAPNQYYSYVTSDTPPEEPRIYINEFMASNSGTIDDPDFGESGDWVELYNSGGTAADISGMYLTDDLSEPDKWQFPDGASIAAGAFLLVWCDDSNTFQTAYHTSFKLSAGGESVGLFDTDGTTPVDSLTFGNQSTDISYGRLPDGGGNWQSFTTPTPGQSNGP